MQYIDKGESIVDAAAASAASSCLLEEGESRKKRKLQQLLQPADAAGAAAAEILVARRSQKYLSLQESGTAVVDVTSKSQTMFVRLSPFFAHMDANGQKCLFLPHLPEYRTYSVEGGWQGMKVFENEGIDLKKLDNDKGSKLKRGGSSKKRGKVLGHFNGDQLLLDYVEARKRIYIPLYKQMLSLPGEVQDVLDELYRLCLENRKLILLDYEVNGNVNDTAKPLSHAHLLKEYLQERMLPR